MVALEDIVIIRCTNPLCKHEAQDRMHGSGMRVMNPQKKLPDKARCTVCKTEVFIPKGTS